MREKSPAFRFYPSDWLNDDWVQSLDRETRDLYFELLLRAWINCGLPESIDDIARMLKVRRGWLERRWPLLRQKFDLDQMTSRWVNTRQEIERQKQRDYTEKQSNNAKLKQTRSAMAQPSTRVVAEPARARFSSSLSSSLSLSLPLTEETISSAVPVFDFEALYKLFPRKEGKEYGLRHCKNKITSVEIYEKVERASKNYAKQRAVDSGPLMIFSTFMCSRWEEWVDGTPTGAIDKPKSQWLVDSAPSAPPVVSGDIKL